MWHFKHVALPAQYFCQLLIPRGMQSLMVFLYVFISNSERLHHHFSRVPPLYRRTEQRAVLFCTPFIQGNEDKNVRELGDRIAEEVARIKDQGNRVAIAMTCCKVESPQTASPKDREHRETGKQVLGPCFAQFPNLAQTHLGIYGFLEAASKAQSLFLGLLFSHLFLFISFHCRGPIVGHKNVTGTIGRTHYLQDCREGRATIAGQKPAASIFSPFLLIPDHIHTPHSGSHEVFTTPLSPSTVLPAVPLNLNYSFPF